MAEKVAAGPGSNLKQTPADSRQDRAREAAHLHPVADGRQDYTVEKDGLRFAATHVLAEFWDAPRIRCRGDTPRCPPGVAGAPPAYGVGGTPPGGPPGRREGLTMGRHRRRLPSCRGNGKSDRMGTI